MRQPEKHNLHRRVLIMVLQINCFFFFFFFCRLKLPPSSLFISALRSHGRLVLVHLDVGTAVKKGFRFEFLKFLKLKINSKCDMSILTVDVTSIFKVLFKN